jgi:ketosteroid isomerase-like protein
VPAREAAERFYGAFLAADEAGISDVLAPRATLLVRGENRLSGEHRGPGGIAALRRLIGELTGGTWRPLRDDSFDVAESPWHAVVMDRFLAERNGHELNSHEVFVLAVEHGRIVRLFHYVHDPDGFTAFWAY